MTVYRYRARTPGGEPVAGTVTAPDAPAALAALRARTLFVTAVMPQRARRVRIPSALRPRAVTPRGRVAFFRCLATLVAAGVPLRRALRVATERSDDRALHAVLAAAGDALERGEALSAALAPHPRAFSPLVVAMIAAGETGGILDEVLSRIATFLERDHDLQRRLIASLAYPATVLAASLALAAFLVVRVVPMFAALFASFHVPLPPQTQLLLWAGAVASQPAGVGTLAALAAAPPLAIAWLRRSPDGRRALDRARFGLPLFGALARTAIDARLARMLGTLLHAGIALDAAFAALVPAAGSELHAVAVERIALAVREGQSLAAPFAASGLFDPLLVTLIGVGEETGMLDRLLLTGADYLEADVATSIATLGAVLEPALIIGLGVIVAGIVSSVFIPLYSLIGGVAQ
jgi:type IV pilus assembly protein PilC